MALLSGIEARAAPKTAKDVEEQQQERRRSNKRGAPASNQSINQSNPLDFLRMRWRGGEERGCVEGSRPSGKRVDELGRDAACAYAADVVLFDFSTFGFCPFAARDAMVCCRAPARRTMCGSDATPLVRVKKGTTQTTREGWEKMETSGDTWSLAQGRDCPDPKDLNAGIFKILCGLHRYPLRRLLPILVTSTSKSQPPSLSLSILPLLAIAEFPHESLLALR